MPARRSSPVTYRQPVHALDRERDLTGLPETGQPGAQMRPVSRRELTATYLPGRQVQVVEGDLLPVDIQSAYDRWHRDLLMLRGRMPNTPIVVRLS